MSLSIKCNKTSDLMVNVSVPEFFPVQIRLICTSFKHFSLSWPLLYMQIIGFMVRGMNFTWSGDSEAMLPHLFARLSKLDMVWRFVYYYSLSYYPLQGWG